MSGRASNNRTTIQRRQPSYIQSGGSIERAIDAEHGADGGRSRGNVAGQSRKSGNSQSAGCRKISNIQISRN